MDNIFKNYSYDEQYKCSSITDSIHFNKLMYLIVHFQEFPDGRNELIKYILTHRNEINEKNEKGWTALMIAVKK